jgi:hypothetical protein
MGIRLSGDVDLFLDWSRRADFAAMLSAVTGALEAAAMKVEVVARSCSKLARSCSPTTR